jgi:hypothetical protein
MPARTLVLTYPSSAAAFLKVGGDELTAGGSLFSDEVALCKIRTKKENRFQIMQLRVELGP